MPFLNTRDGRLYYEVHDLTPPWLKSPDAVVFHHGIAASLHHWNDWLPHFCTTHRIVTFDARGCGMSSVPPVGFDWRLERLAADVLDVATAAGVTRFHFVGDSIGGTVGLHLARRMPDRVLSLTAANCVANGRLLREAASWPAIVDQRGQAGWAEQMMTWRYVADAVPGSQRAWLARELARIPFNVVLSQTHVVLHANLMAELPAIAVPTLLLCGEAAPLVPHAHMAEMQSLIPAAELERYADGRDGLIISHARACALATRAFHFRRAPPHDPGIPHVA